MEHHDETPDPLPYALAELEAYNQGWESRAVRAVAFGGMRVLALRVLDWRESVGQPCVDAVEVQAWVEDRIAEKVLAWPPQASGVPLPSVYDLLRKACRLEYDRHQRARGLDLDALGTAEAADAAAWERLNDTDAARIVAWVFGDRNPSDQERAA